MSARLGVMRASIAGLAPALACAPASVVSPSQLPAAAPRVQRIEVARYGAPCRFAIEDREQIERVAAFFADIRPRPASEVRSFQLWIETNDGGSTAYTLGDDWVALERTGHTYQTSAWGFRDGSLFAYLRDAAEENCP